MGMRDAWFLPVVCAGDECEINPRKSGREPAFEYLSKPVRTAAQKSFMDFLRRGSSVVRPRVVAIVDTPASFHSVSSG